MRSRTKRAGKRSKQPWIAGALALVVAAGVVAAIVWRAARIDNLNPSSPQPGAPWTVTPADWALPDDLPPLPPLPAPRKPLPRPASVVRAAYDAAARHPEVLGQLPCFCGCRKLGHRSNHDCFISARGAGGSVAWDVHGMG